LAIVIVLGMSSSNLTWVSTRNYYEDRLLKVMPVDDDEIKIQHALPGRPQSPALERTARLAIEAALGELVSRKLLYQKVTIDLSGLAQAIGSPELTTPDQLSLLETEVAARPWELETHHQGDNPIHLTIFASANVGGQPIGTPLNQMNIHFYAPGVQLECPTCKGERTFIALQSSRQFNLEQPYPRPSMRGQTEQVYTLYYRCEGCRKFMHAVLFRREGLRLHLSGFAPRRVQKSNRTLPPALQPILNDANNAVAEGDLYAGFYHLRTLVEHFAKLKLGVPLETRERGEDLLATYGKTIPASLAATLPSLAMSYDVLSKRMHARSGTPEEFAKQVDAICDHIEGAALLAKYASA
jgi:hypothetical protein